MKPICEALKEFNKTSPILKPLLCCNTSTGMYLVTVGFSKKFVESKNLIVVK